MESSAYNEFERSKHRAFCVRPTTRHWLKANGEDVKVVQELMRHANSKITPSTPTPKRSRHKTKNPDDGRQLILAKRDDARLAAP
jgi:hypothetical protein